MKSLEHLLCVLFIRWEVETHGLKTHALLSQVAEKVAQIADAVVIFVIEQKVIFSTI